MTVITTIVKIVKLQEHAQQFRSGKLFMRSLKYFREHEAEIHPLRADPYEGAGAILQPSLLETINFGGFKMDPKRMVGPMKVTPKHLKNARVFCAYSLNSRGFDTVSADTLPAVKAVLQIHKSCFEFGSIAVSVTDLRLFLDRVARAIENLKAEGSGGLVDYFEESEFHGDLPRPGFHKPKRFESQREYRIMVNRRKPLSDPYVLDVGDLSDIVNIVTVEEFNRTLRISLPDGSSA